MENIAKPTKINFKKGKKTNQGVVMIEPCYPGYGMTLGNNLRRVLLSSLSGAAVVGVKIKGADHEFTTIPYVKEDMLEIILNLKQLRLKVFGDEEVKLQLDIHGKKVVKASDITKNAQAEIINKELVLANITDMAGSLNIEIYVNKGRGYRPVESIENKKNEIGYIEVDSIFSPVLSASVDVENVRVGKMTNWDKLILDIITDGTISPNDAFEESVKILIDQFKSLIGGKKDVGEEGEKEIKETSKQIEDKKEREDKKEKGEIDLEKDIKENEVNAKVGKVKELLDNNDLSEQAEVEPDKKKKRGRPKKI